MDIRAVYILINVLTLTLVARAEDVANAVTSKAGYYDRDLPVRFSRSLGKDPDEDRVERQTDEGNDLDIFGSDEDDTDVIEIPDDMLNAFKEFMQNASQEFGRSGPGDDMLSKALVNPYDKSNTASINRYPTGFQDTREAKYFENLGKRMGCSDKYCYPELYSLKFEGDIVLDEEQRNAIDKKTHLWPRGVIPYSFQSSVSSDDKNVIMKAMKNLESKTCIKFVPHFYHLQYIQISTDKKGCYATIGHRPLGLGASPVNLQSPECLYQIGTVEHELLHVIGLFHEQARSDRDDYVDIYWDRIDKQYYSEFGKADESLVSTYDVPYDYKSVMHYPKYAFTKDGRDTIVAKNDTSIDLGQRDGAAEGDIKKVNMMYNCNKN